MALHPNDEVRGVRLGDVFRDTDDELWEVTGLCTDPIAYVRKVTTGAQEHHVIGCLNWTSKWKSGPLRSST